MSQGVLSLFPPSWGHIPVQLSTPTAETLGHTPLPRQRAVATAPPVMRWRLKQDFFGLRLKRSLTLSYGRTYQKLTESTCCQAGAKDRGCFTHGKPMALHEVLHPPSDRGRNFSRSVLFFKCLPCFVVTADLGDLNDLAIFLPSYVTKFAFPTF